MTSTRMVYFTDAARKTWDSLYQTVEADEIARATEGRGKQRKSRSPKRAKERERAVEARRVLVEVAGVVDQMRNGPIRATRKRDESTIGGFDLHDCFSVDLETRGKAQARDRGTHRLVFKATRDDQGKPAILVVGFGAKTNRFYAAMAATLDRMRGVRAEPPLPEVPLGRGTEDNPNRGERLAQQRAERAQAANQARANHTARAGVRPLIMTPAPTALPADCAKMRPQSPVTRHSASPPRPPGAGDQTR